MFSISNTCLWKYLRYGKENESGSSSGVNIGPISLTVQQIYTSIMSAVVVAPPVILLIALYEKSAPPVLKPSKANGEYISKVLVN